MEAHLEFMSTEQGCSWEHGYTDYDGTHAYVMCGEVAEVALVYWDSWDRTMNRVEFCRAHGNLALIEERKSA